jgi:N-carbamoylputrescine amidase
MPVDNVVRVAMAQMHTEWGAPEKNLSHAAEMIGRGADEGCQIVVLPECLDLGWTHPDTAALAESVPGPRSEALGAAASEAGVWAVAGLTERDGDAVYNTAVLLDSDGCVVLKHRKINILDVAQPHYATGDRLCVARTPFGTVGLAICADNFPDSLVLAHSLCFMGARIILSPCAWAVKADFSGPYGAQWKSAYREIAQLYETPTVGVSNVGRVRGGPWEGRLCIGNSLAFSRQGEMLVEGPFGEDAEALIPVELELTAMPARGTLLCDMLRKKGHRSPRPRGLQGADSNCR